MNMLWSSEQQAWLKALGCRVLVLAGDEPAAFGDETLGDAHVAAPVPASPAPREAHRPVDVAGRTPAAPPTQPDRRSPATISDDGVPPRVAAQDETTGAAASAPSRAPGDTLERALFRATGQRTRSEARAVLQRLDVEVQALRGDPAAKRALWLRLRPLQPRFRR